MTTETKSKNSRADFPRASFNLLYPLIECMDEYKWRNKVKNKSDLIRMILWDYIKKTDPELYEEYYKLEQELQENKEKEKSDGVTSK